MSRPQLFLSAVSEELKTARGIAAETVYSLGYDPISQDNFPTGYGGLCAWLREQIDRCEGLIQLVGHGYGAEPPNGTSEFGRVSYTQYELFYARSKGKKTWLIFIEDGYPCDKQPDCLDLPPGSHLDPPSYQAERQKLQQDYIARLHAENHRRHYVGNETDLKLKIRELRDELAILREKYEEQLRGLDAGIKRIHEAVQQAAVVNTEKIRGHLLQTVEETHRRELAEAENPTAWKERERRRKAAETAHAARLSRIEDLVVAFAEIERTDTATAVFREMDRILREQGVDEAIAYVETQSDSILQTVRARTVAARERNRADLQPLLRTASLYQAKGQPDKARGLYTEILAAEPNWPEALHENFRFLVEQGDVARIRTTLTQARHDYEEAHHRAQRLTAIDSGSSKWQRDLAASYERLGDVAVAQGKLAEAARAYADGLAILKKLSDTDASNTEWRRDLSVTTNKLGDVAKAQGKLEDAARAYADSLAICKKLADSDPSNTLWQCDLSIAYNKLGDVAAAQGELEDAARDYGDSLAIRKKLAAMGPSNTEGQRDLAISYGKLGDVAADQGKLEDTVRAYANGLANCKKLAAMDPDNTVWQRDLAASYERLGDVAAAQGKLEDAASAYAHALVIAKKLATMDPSNTLWQRDLSVCYNKAGHVAGDQGKLQEAAQFYSIGLAIAKRLAALDPSNALWQRDVWVSYWNLACVAERLNRADEAHNYLKQTLGVLDAIEKKGLHLSPEDRQWLEILRGKVGADAQ